MGEIIFMKSVKFLVMILKCSLMRNATIIKA
jgi:hypothetical protein